MEHFSGYNSTYQNDLLEKYLAGFEEKISRMIGRQQALELKDEILSGFARECESKIIKTQVLEIADNIVNKYFPEKV